jgi:hypothetical protein
MLVQLLFFKNFPSILLDSEPKVGKVSKMGFYLMNILMCKFSKSTSQKKFLLRMTIDQHVLTEYFPRKNFEILTTTKRF